MPQATQQKTPKASRITPLDELLATVSGMTSNELRAAARAISRNRDVHERHRDQVVSLLEAVAHTIADDR
jgi:hypothetical protein